MNHTYMYLTCGVLIILIWQYDNVYMFFYFKLCIYIEKIRRWIMSVIIGIDWIEQVFEIHKLSIYLDES